MTPLWVNAVKVGFVGVLYLFLWYVARAVAAHVTTTPSGRGLTARDVGRPAGFPVLAIVDAEGAPTRHIEVRGPLVVGRHAADIVVEDAFASERHALVDLEGGRVVVEDLGSTNGTLVNEIAIRQRTTLAKGDRVRIGTTTMEVR